MKWDSPIQPTFLIGDFLIDGSHFCTFNPVSVFFYRWHIPTITPENHSYDVSGFPGIGFVPASLEYSLSWRPPASEPNSELCPFHHLFYSAPARVSKGRLQAGIFIRGSKFLRRWYFKPAYFSPRGAFLSRNIFFRRKDLSFPQRYDPILIS